MRHEFHIQKPVTANSPAPADCMVIKIFYDHDLLTRYPPYFLEKRLRVRHVMKHRYKDRHIKTLIRERDPGAIIQHHRSPLVTGFYDIQNQMFMSSCLKRRGIKTPAASQIQNPAPPRDLTFKKPNDLFCPGFQSAMSEIPDNPV